MSHVALRNLVAVGQISATLAAQVTALADAGVPIVVTGGAPADRRDALAAAIAAASPLPAGAESVEIKIAPEEAFVWLADPAGVGCLVAGAGGAPRSPRSTRLIAHGLIERLSAATTKTVVRSLVRGFPLIATAPGHDLAELLDLLRGANLRVPEDDLHRLGLVIVLGGDVGAQSHVESAHLLRAPALDGGARRPPALLATWNGRGGWDDFSWAALPELAARVGVTQAAYSSQLAARERELATP
ncbi:MAG: hypothetical protein NTV27_04435 [Chloroflexi bacterium]|nr:hypothetical protein [Chloroflexota bacterium]